MVHTASVTKTIREQMLDQGLVKPEDTQEGRRAAADAARLPMTEKRIPLAFEAPARGVIVASSGPAEVARARCIDCGAVLPRTQRNAEAAGRCAECAINGG